jgi:hypothetical protein
MNGAGFERRLRKLEDAGGIEESDWQYQFLRSINGDAEAKAKIAEARASGKSRSFNAWEAGMDELLASVEARRGSGGLPDVLSESDCEGMGAA